MIKFGAEYENSYTLKNHEIPHLHHNYRKFMPLSRHQLKIYAFSVKFNVCSKWVLLPWIKICRDFTLETQIFTQKNESWLRFYSEFLSKKLAAGVSAWTILWSIPAAPLGLAYSHRKVILTFVLIHNESDKNSHILPTGQWYAPSAFINDALIMQWIVQCRVQCIVECIVKVKVYCI